MEPADFNACLAQDVLKYPVFVKPDGFSGPMMFEIVGGARTYIAALANKLTRARIVTGAPVQNVTRAGDQFRVDGSCLCDHLILATDANAAACPASNTTTRESQCTATGAGCRPIRVISR